VSKVASTSKEDPEDIRLRLIGASKEHFLEIKRVMGFKQDTEVMRFLVTDYFLSHMTISQEFVEWFAKQPHKSVIKLSEVFDAYERFKREKQGSS